jgi:hypothetical protein
LPRKFPPKGARGDAPLSLVSPPDEETAVLCESEDTV